jgi:hypothetical protein
MDASGILGKYENKDVSPSQSFFQFATDMHIPVSYYLGTEDAYRIVYDHLNLRDRIAFFAFCIYRSIKNIDNENLNASDHKAVFYEFADSMLEDESFMKSMSKNIFGEQLRCVGTRKINGVMIYGIARNTGAYKKAFAYLKEHELL